MSNKLEGTPWLEHEPNHSPPFSAECVELYHHAHTQLHCLTRREFTDRLERGEEKYI